MSDPYDGERDSAHGMLQLNREEYKSRNILKITSFADSLLRKVFCLIKCVLICFEID